MASEVPQQQPQSLTAAAIASLSPAAAGHEEDTAALADAISALLHPSTNVVQKVDQVVRIQLQLQTELDALNHKLSIVTAQNTSGVQQGQMVDRYITRLRQCRNRVDALARDLNTLKNRLVRVHAHLGASTRAVERSNSQLEEQLEKTVESAPPTAETAKDEGGAPAVTTSTTADSTDGDNGAVASTE